jgi:PGF-pre-PGF domain-containing protein
MKSKNILYSKTFVSLFLVSFLIFISSTTLADPVQGASPAAIYAYISNQDGTISVLDTTNSTITATVNVGGYPSGVAVSPDGKKVFVANYLSNTVSVITTTTNTVTANVDVGGSSSEVVVTPDGKKVYVTSRGNNTVSVIDTANDTAIATVPVGNGPTRVAVSPDGTKVYVINEYSHTVSFIDTATNTVIATVNVEEPCGITVSPDGTKVYVANFNSGNVSVIDTATNTVTATVNAGRFLREIAVSPDGSKVYVTNYLERDYIVTVIDTATNTVTATVNVGNSARGIAFNPSGTKAFVTNPDCGMVSIIDTATNRVTSTVNIGGSPIVNGPFIIPRSALKPVLYVNFSSNLTSGYAPLTVQFTDLSQNATGWYWDFGDGTTSTDQNPTHTYSSAGPSTVKLIANNGNDTDSKFAIITALDYNFPPVADFAANPSRGGNPLFVQFTDLSQNAAGWNWDFGDGATSTLQNPRHIYIDYSTFSGEGGVINIQRSYIVTLTLSNENVTASKKATMVMDRQFYVPPGSGKSSGGGGGGSPEPAKNVEVMELSQVFITNGKAVKFDFTKNATCVVSVGFDSKKTAGKITTIVEMLKNQSTLTSDTPTGEVYNYLNIWVGNSGYATEKNIGNATVCFKVEKSWIQDKNIDQSSIILHRYSEKKWDPLPTSQFGEDDRYLYFTAETPGFSPFAITGKIAAKGFGNETQPVAVNEIQNKPINGSLGNNNGNATANIEQTPEQIQSSNTSGKGSTKMSDFEIASGIISLLSVFLYKRK